MSVELCFDHTLSVCIMPCYCKHVVIIVLLVIIGISCSLLLRACPNLVSSLDNFYV